jgi:hypothetical protein
VLRQVASGELVHYARGDARNAVAVLDQVGLTPDFEPSKVEVGIETARAPVLYP